MTDPREGFQIEREFGPEDFYSYPLGFENGFWFNNVYDSDVGAWRFQTSSDRFTGYTDRGYLSADLPLGAQPAIITPRFQGGYWWLWGASNQGLYSGFPVPYLIWSDDLETWHKVTFANGFGSGTGGNAAYAGLPTYYAAGDFYWTFIILTGSGFDELAQVYIATGDSPTADWTIDLDNQLLQVPSGYSPGEYVYYYRVRSSAAGQWLSNIWAGFNTDSQVNDGRPFLAYGVRHDDYTDYVVRHPETDSPLTDWSDPAVIDRRYDDGGGPVGQGPLDEDANPASITAGGGYWVALASEGEGLYWSSGLPIDNSWEFLSLPGLVTSLTVEYGDGVWVVAGLDVDGNIRVFSGATPEQIVEVDVEPPSVQYAYYYYWELNYGFYEGGGEWWIYFYTENEDGDWRESYLIPGGSNDGWGILLI